jgi:formylglycine-generating enzyme required for sulfatase activity
MNLSHELSLALAPEVDLKLVHVPAGEFLMGSDRALDPLTLDAELPQHKLFLHAYFIGQSPVTVAQFAAFVQATGYRTTAEQIGHGYNLVDGQWSETKGADWQSPYGAGSGVRQKDAHPVTLVSWYDALAFCKWATDLSDNQIDLPSEAEWEQAARGMDGRIYPWGNAEPTEVLCNFNLNVQDTSVVGHYSPQGDSPVGATDMAGNVLEWTRSLWGVDIHSPEFTYPYTERMLERENLQADENVRRVVRGGAWDDDREGVRSAYRIPNPPIARNNLLGFRVCCHLPLSLSEDI